MSSGQVSNRTFVKMLVGGSRGLKREYPHIPSPILQTALRTFPVSGKIQVSTKRLKEKINNLYANYLLKKIKSVPRTKRLPFGFMARYAIKTKKTMKPRRSPSLNINFNSMHL